MLALIFCDADDGVIGEIDFEDETKYHNAEWETFELEEGEDIIGIQAREGDYNLFGIGFITIQKWQTVHN